MMCHCLEGLTYGDHNEIFRQMSIDFATRNLSWSQILDRCRELKDEVYNIKHFAFYQSKQQHCGGRSDGSARPHVAAQGAGLVEKLRTLVSCLSNQQGSPKKIE